METLYNLFIKCGRTEAAVANHTEKSIKAFE